MVGSGTSVVIIPMSSVGNVKSGGGGPIVIPLVVVVVEVGGGIVVPSTIIPVGRKTMV